MYSERTIATIFKTLLPYEVSSIVYQNYKQQVFKQRIQIFEKVFMGSKSRVVEYITDDFVSKELYVRDEDDPVYALVYDGEDRYEVFVKKLTINPFYF